MAEGGAYLTATSEGRPSIFDLVAQDSLMDNLRPALYHLLKVLAEYNPVRFSWCYRFADEIHLSLNTLLQHHYLSHYGASFAENFYDLKRVPLNVEKLRSYSPFSMNRSVYRKCMAALVLFPFVRLKFQKYFEELKLDENEPSNRNQIWSIIHKTFLRLWPIVHFLWELLAMVYFVRYLVGGQKCHSPLLHLSGLSLQNLTESDCELIEERSSQIISYSNVSSATDAARWIVENLATGMKNSLELGAFFLQFLEWYYSSSSTNSTARMFGEKEIPPPPQTAYKHPTLEDNICPICMKERKGCTVLSVSGYVFCYVCIYEHLKKHGYCPVTKYPASTKQMIKIYNEG